MKRWLLLLALLMVPVGLNAQVYTGDGAGVGVMPGPYAPGRYRLRDAYPAYPGNYPAGPQTSPDTAEVGRPYYYPYAYPGGTYGNPGIYSDGDTVYVPGR